MLKTSVNTILTKALSRHCRFFIFLLLLTGSFSSVLGAQTVTVAVASNFHSALKALKKQFELNTGIPVIIIPGSTGKLYAQIIHGAPFDIFMAADKQRPLLLEQNSVGVSGSRFTYANGRLALWSIDRDRVDNKGKILESDNILRIALANPKLAPYGKATMEFIHARKLMAVKEKLVQGESIAQAFHLTARCSAELGFIALSQLQNPDKPVSGSYWVVPETYHQPIEQQVILINNSEAARAFIDFLQTPDALEIIASFGYRTSSTRQAKGAE